MQIRETDLPGVVIVEPRVFADGRGFFKETFQQQRYEEAGIRGPFVQDNFSLSAQGILRGLHFQIQHPQSKLVSCLRGEIFDVAVDLRRDSDNFGQWTGAVLSGENHLQFYIPRGFAHGFYVLSDTAEMLYKCDDYYHPEYDRTLLWNDADVNINWPLKGEPTLSEKDRAGKPLSQVECFETSPQSQGERPV